MADEWDRGVLAKSSWHRLETIAKMMTGADLIAHGRKCGAWPLTLRYEPVRTEGGIVIPKAKAVVASYEAHADRVLGLNGSRFRATTPDEWASVVEAATKAGAVPTGAFSLRNGSRVLATFEVGKSNGIKTHLTLADAFDGSMFLLGMKSAIRVVCANTLAAAVAADGGGMAQLRHTASLEEKIEGLRVAIADAVTSGETVRELYHKAEASRLTRADAEDVFDALWPKAAKDAEPATKTRAENARAEARKAMLNPVNNVGPTLATLWNAATFLVDRTGDGHKRPTRGETDALDSLLFGSRARKVEAIGKVIETVMKDGTVVPMTAYEASDAGVDPHAIGRTVLDDMLGD